VSTPLALSLVLEVARRFAENFGPVSAMELAGEAGTSEDEIRDTLRPLVQARILSLSVSGGFRYQPARPLENILLTEILDAVKEKDSSALVLPNYRQLVQQLLGRTRTAEQRELEGVTLRDILAAQSADE
jgi:DNA-binding IscR family transcriptional regulator